MNVEIVQTDWGTVTQRRASREPVEKGGCIRTAYRKSLTGLIEATGAYFWNFRRV